MEKHSTWVTMDQYQEFIRTGRWLTDCQDPILDEFERYVHLKTLQPKIIVEYLREGYQSRNTDNIRLTFDHQVQSACAKTLFPDAPFFRGHHRGVIILEIKCNKRQPEWLRSLVQAHGLRIMANSKFVQGITLASPDIVTPVWSS
jgi:SPX domain protein involved in polyphosphate accumulation